MEKTKTLKFHIHRFLATQKAQGIEWTAGGVIEDHVRSTKGSKGTTTSRQLRYMCQSEEGRAPHLLSKVEKFAWYKINPSYVQNPHKRRRRVKYVPPECTCEQFSFTGWCSHLADIRARQREQRLREDEMPSLDEPFEPKVEINKSTNLL